MLWHIEGGALKKSDPRLLRSCLSSLDHDPDPRGSLTAPARSRGSMLCIAPASRFSTNRLTDQFRDISVQWDKIKRPFPPLCERYSFEKNISVKNLEIICGTVYLVTSRRWLFVEIKYYSFLIHNMRASLIHRQFFSAALFKLSRPEASPVVALRSQLRFVFQLVLFHSLLNNFSFRVSVSFPWNTREHISATVTSHVFHSGFPRRRYEVKYASSLL